MEKKLFVGQNRHFYLIFENVTKIYAVTLKMNLHSQMKAQNNRLKMFEKKQL